MFKKKVASYCENTKCREHNKPVDINMDMCPVCALPLASKDVLNTPMAAGAGVAALLFFAAIGYVAVQQIGGRSGIGMGSSTDTRNLAFAVQTDDGGGFRTVGHDYRFRAGDKFRLLARTSFPGYIYAFHRDRASGRFDVLVIGSQAIAAGQETVVPSRGTMRMDNSAGPEEFTLIASVQPLEDLQFSADSVADDSFQEAVRRALKGVVPGKLDNDGEWRKVVGNEILRASLVLRHE